MSKLIDADKVKEAISEKTVATRKTECEVCHGTGKISLAFYEDIQKRCRR